MTTLPAKQTRIITQFENALSHMTSCAYCAAKNRGSIDNINLIFDILEEHKMQADIHPVKFDEDMDIINVKAKNLWEEDPSDKIIRLKSALFTMSNHVRRIFKEDGSFEAGNGIILGILESNGIE